MTEQAALKFFALYAPPRSQDLCKVLQDSDLFMSAANYDYQLQKCFVIFTLIKMPEAAFKFDHQGMMSFEVKEHINNVIFPPEVLAMMKKTVIR